MSCIFWGKLDTPCDIVHHFGLFFLREMLMSFQRDQIPSTSPVSWKMLQLRMVSTILKRVRLLNFWRISKLSDVVWALLC